MVSKMKDCYTCGHEELSLDLVVYCTLCEETMMHRYCLDGPIVYGDEQVVWFCDECSPKFEVEVEVEVETNLKVEVGSSNPQFEQVEGGTSALVPQFSTMASDDLKPNSEKCLLSQSEFNYGKDLAMDFESKNFIVDTDSKLKILGNPNLCLEQVDLCKNLDMLSDNDKDHFSNQKQEYVVPNACDGVLTPEDVDMLENRVKFSYHDTNHELNQRKESTLPLRPENLKDAEPESGKPIHSNEGHELPLGDVDLLEMMDVLKDLDETSQTVSPSLKTVPSLLKDDISWRGKCIISHGIDYKISIEMKAHLSVNASCNVDNATETLPTTLNLEMVPKIENWPKRFDVLPPSHEDIGLYFFPTHRSDEKLCAGLLEKMMEDDLVLKFAKDDLNLRMFNSFDLPKEFYCYNNKCYLWGVFSSLASSSSSNATQEKENDHLLNRGSKSVCITKGSKFGYEKKVKRQCIALDCTQLKFPPVANKKHKQVRNAYPTSFASTNTRNLEHKDGQALPMSKSTNKVNYKYSSVHAKVRKMSPSEGFYSLQTGVDATKVRKMSTNEGFSSLRIGVDATKVRKMSPNEGFSSLRSGVNAIEKLHFEKGEKMEKVFKPQSYDWKDTCYSKEEKVRSTSDEHCPKRRFLPYHVTQRMESKRTTLSEERIGGYEKRTKSYEKYEGCHKRTKNYHRKTKDCHEKVEGYDKIGYNQKVAFVKC